MIYTLRPILALGFCLLSYSTAIASIDQLLPKPQHIERHAGKCSSHKFKAEGLYLQEELKALLKKYHYTEQGDGAVIIRTSIVPSLPKVYFNKEEAYRLRVSPQGIYIDALERTGLYRGLQTLDQLMATADSLGGIEACDIIDWPAFRLRGLMHDVGRTFIPIEELKKQIKLLAAYKINALHLHLTENQAWRIESKLYPQLNKASSMTRMAGQYYTLSELKSLAKLCQDLRVVLIPEIDLPGHSAAFHRAMGFDMQTTQGKQVLKQLIQELAQALQVPYIHIGTDEASFSDANFISEMVAEVRQQGKKAIAWNPGWHFRSGEIDMLHLWSSRGRGMYGTPSIDSRLHYINHYDRFADIQMLYSSRILEVSASNTNVMGAILAVWNDRYIPSTQGIMSENNVYPNMLALAERAWRGGGSGYFDAPTAALSPLASKQTKQEFIDFERRLLWHKRHQFVDEPFPYIQQSQATWYISRVYPNNGNLANSYEPEELYFRQGKQHTYTPPSAIDTLHLPYTNWVKGSGAYLRHVWGKTCYGLIPDAQENSTVYVTSWIYSPHSMKAGLAFETQNYSRSESDLPPRQGTWDYKGSRLWINGAELPPPVWTNTHKKRDHEHPLGNENAVSRPPLPISLRKGWNQILIKLPIGKFSIPEVRLNKWMFSAAITNTQGTEALEGITYATPPIKP